MEMILREGAGGSACLLPTNPLVWAMSAATGTSFHPSHSNRQFVFIFPTQFSHASTAGDQCFQW